VFTYLGNMLAESFKGSYNSATSSRCKLFTKILAPTFAVTTLTIITGFILSKAISILSDPPAENSVEAEIMYTFSILNFVIDGICVVAFAFRGKEVFYETRGIPQLSLDTSVHSEGSDDFGHLDDDLELQPTQRTEKDTTLVSLLWSYYCCPCSSGSRFNTADEKNLNMLSAFTHLSGDTLRTISVFVAALVSTVAGINSDLCDAWAAIVVSATIVVIMIPLVRDICSEVSTACRNWSDYGEHEGDQEYIPVSIQADEESEPIAHKSVVGKGKPNSSISKASPTRNDGTKSGTNKTTQRGQVPSSPSNSDGSLEYVSVKSDNPAPKGTSIAVIAAKMKTVGKDSDRIDDYLFVDGDNHDDEKLLF
jgi:Co/Zn/Cd efflux system component